MNEKDERDYSGYYGDENAKESTLDNNFSDYTDDDWIQEEANDALSRNSNINANEIKVIVKDKIVYLSGTVKNRMAKSIAEECVEYIPGVEDVQNQLRVA